MWEFLTCWLRPAHKEVLSFRHLVISRSCFAEGGKENVQRFKTRAEQLFCSLNLLFRLWAAIATVVFLSSLMTQKPTKGDFWALKNLKHFLRSEASTLDAQFFGSMLILALKAQYWHYMLRTPLLLFWFSRKQGVYC